MDLDKILKTGNEVRIRSASDSFITTIDEVTGEDTFTILAPYRQGRQISVDPADIFSVSCVTDQGLYMFETRVTRVDDSSSIIVIHLQTTGEVRRVQRRQAFRVRESITVNARRQAGEPSAEAPWLKTNTVDIAELGTLMKFDEKCEPGQELEMTLRINLFGINEVVPKVRGRVVRCVPTRNKEFGYLVGIMFEDMPEKARDALIKLVVLSQRNKLTYKNIKKFR